MPDPRTFGDEVMDILRGRAPNALVPQVMVDRRQGLDGYHVSVEANAGGEFMLQSIRFFTDNSLADAHIVKMLGYQGTIKTLTDEFGKETENILVAKVDHTRIRKEKVKRQGVDQWRVQIDYECVRLV